MAKSKSHITSEDLEQFEDYLFEMDDVLERFVAAAQAASFRLDYSIDSLDDLEAYWLASNEPIPDGTLGNRAARYLGEVFRRQFGGKWVLCDKGPRYLYHKRPVIAGYARMDIEFCPIQIFANFAGRRERGLLRRAVEAHEEFVA